MTVFEVAFNLVAVVLGLALVSVLSGLTRVIRQGGLRRLGWLTPMLGGLVLLDVTSFWGSAYEIRERLPSVWQSLGGGLVIASGYYVAAASVFPADLDTQGAPDAAYWRERRLVLSLLLACNLTLWLAERALGRPWSAQIVAINTVYAAGLAAAALLPGRRLHLVLLAGLIAIQAYSFIIP
jgi:hypothetical protein